MDSEQRSSPLLGVNSAARALRRPEWAAEFLGMPVDWVLEAAADGRLPCVRFERAVRFDPLELKTWVRRQGATESPTVDCSSDEVLGAKPAEAVGNGRRESGSDAFLTVDEAAEVLRVNRKSLYEAIQLDQVPGVVRVGRAIRISRAALVEFGWGKGSPALGANR